MVGGAGAECVMVASSAWGGLRLGHVWWGWVEAGYTVGRFCPFACQCALMLLVKGRPLQNCAWHWWVTVFPRDLQPGCMAARSDWETRGAEGTLPWPTYIIFCKHSASVRHWQDRTSGCWPKKCGNCEWQGWEAGRRKRSGHRHRNI